MKLFFQFILTIIGILLWIIIDPLAVLIILVAGILWIMN